MRSANLCPINFCDRVWTIKLVDCSRLAECRRLILSFGVIIGGFLVGEFESLAIGRIFEAIRSALLPLL
jgi:hypothetical protein